MAAVTSSWSAGRRRATTGRRPVLSAAGWAGLASGSALIGAAAVRQPTLVALGVSAAVLAVLLARPNWAAVLAVAVLPFPVDVVPGNLVKVSATDLLTLVAVTGWLVEGALLGRRTLGTTALRAMGVGLAAYGAAAGLSLIAHPTSAGVATASQRALLLIGGLLLGERLVRAGLLRPTLGVFVASSSVLAVGALVFSGSDAILGVQKNPAGGYLVAALLVAIVVRPYRWWWLAAPLLALGAVATQSRGALVGLAAATVVTVLVVRYHERRKVFAALVLAAGALAVGYSSLPDTAKSRLQTLSGSSDFAIRYRDEFQADALDAFRSQPWLGVGLGNYNGGARQPGINDPHQVVYYELAEGGVILLGGLVILLAVFAFLSVRDVGRCTVAVAALAVQVSTFVHALGDVYWVRGTPTPAFLLLGASIAVVALQRRGDPRGLEWVPSGRHRAGGGSTPREAESSALVDA